jgi:indole-3-glycerol phosphate synthase
MSLLERILAAKRVEIARLRQRPLPTPPPLRALGLRRGTGEPLRLMAEIKRRSPSAGALSTTLTVAERAAAYERGGARMVSVLCDREFFDGDYAHLAEAARSCSLPLLCKDFVIDEWQLDAARAWGASAALIIVRCVSPNDLRALVTGCRDRDLEPLVEVSNDDESEAALAAGATLVGVNARDLDTLQMDPERAARILAGLPSSVTSIHLSGLRTADDVRRLANTTAHAALVGEALMRLDDPDPLLRDMVDAAG